MDHKSREIGFIIKSYRAFEEYKVSHLRQSDAELTHNKEEAALKDQHNTYQHILRETGGGGGGERQQLFIYCYINIPRRSFQQAQRELRFPINGARFSRNKNGF